MDHDDFQSLQQSQKYNVPEDLVNSQNYVMGRKASF